MSNRNLSKKRRATRSNFEFMWASMGMHNKLINGEKDVCDHFECIEDHTHVLCCQAPLTTEYQEGLMSDLVTNLDKVKTHPDLVMIVNYRAQNVTSAVLLDVSGHPEETSMCELIEKQIKKDGFTFFMGFWLRS